MRMNRNGMTALIMLLLSAFLLPAGSAADGSEMSGMREAVEAAGGDWAAIEEFLLSLSPEEREKVIESYPERIAEVEDIQRSIEESGANWTAGLNPIFLLPPEDRRRLLGGLSETDGNETAQNETTPRSEVDLESPGGTFPNSFDWRNAGGFDWTTPIRNQNPCGSCWAFAVCGALESRMKIAAGNPNLQPDLSEQEILSCSPGDCSGWYLSSTSDWMLCEGTVDESCYPYLASDTAPCRGSCPDRESRRYYITDWCWVGDGPGGTINDAPLDALKEEITCCGPVATYMEVYSDFWGYSGGIYKKTTGATFEGGHFVVIVGWGYDATNGWYLICKNSWGTGWGESGWFRIKWNEVRIEDETIAHQPRRAASVLFYEGHVPMYDFQLSSGYDEWGNILAGNGYFVQSTTETPVTSNMLNCYDVVIISNPTNSFSTSELAAIKEFVGRGRVIGSGDGSWPSDDAIYLQDNERMAIGYIDWLASGEGGGLFVLGERQLSNTVANQVANLFGLKFNYDIIYDPKRYDTETYWPILGPNDDVEVLASCSLDISKDASILARATSSGYASASMPSWDWSGSDNDAYIGGESNVTPEELNPGTMDDHSDDPMPPEDLELGAAAGEGSPGGAGLSFTGPIGIAAVDFGRKGEDTIGVFRPSNQGWYLDYNNDAVPDAIISYGLNGDKPLAGDWNGDGKDTIGVFRPSNRGWYLDYNNDAIPDKVITYGLTGDQAVAGDWNGDGKDTIGVFRPSNQWWYLDYNNDAIPDATITYGLNGDQAVAGDWNGDGKDTIGVFRPSNQQWYLDHNNDAIPDQIITYGISGDLPVVGDWNGNGKDTIGVFRPSNQGWYLDYNNDAVPDKIIIYGLGGDLPVSGDWYKKYS